MRRARARTFRSLDRGRRAVPRDARLERCTGLRDVEVVAGEDADARSAGDGVARVLLDVVEAGLLHERCEDGDLPGAIEEREDVRREGIGWPPAREGLDVSAVVSLGRDDMPDATARVVHVTREARDDVHVQVHHGLTRGSAGVEADVVAVGMQLGVEGALHDVDEREKSSSFVFVCAEPVSDDTTRDDQRVTGRDGVTVADSEGVLVRRDPLRRGDLEEDRHERSILEHDDLEWPIRRSGR